MPPHREVALLWGVSVLTLALLAQANMGPVWFVLLLLAAVPTLLLAPR